MPDEEKKKKRKLVVEETSEPEPVVEAEISEESSGQLDSETSGQREEEITEEKIEPEVEEHKEEPVTPKKEMPKKSILIPMDEKEIEGGVPKSADDESKVGTFWVFALILFIVASLVGGGVLIFKAGVEKGRLEAGTTPTAQASAIPTPTATPNAEVKKEDLKIQVLNGTGKAGMAATAKEYLEGLGYKDVATGNADSSDFGETLISIKDSKKDYLETLKTDLAKEYKVSASTSTLGASSAFDAVVTLGAE